MKKKKRGREEKRRCGGGRECGLVGGLVVVWPERERGREKHNTTRAGESRQIQ